MNPKKEYMKPQVLLVDDNDDMLEFLSADLSEKYSILTAKDGSEAIGILSEEAVNLVISDVMMPVMNGFEFCRIVKSNIEYSHIPIILLTAKNTLQSKIEGLEIGADAYIEKPFSPEYLHVQISNLLNNRNLVKEYYANTPLAHIRSMAHTRADEIFLETVNEVVQNHMEDVELDVEHLAKYMNMSRPTLYRKLKGITNLTPNEIINITRLKKAAYYLTEGKFSIQEIAEKVGYTSPTHFGRNFQKQFGITPSEYMKK